MSVWGRSCGCRCTGGVFGAGWSTEDTVAPAGVDVRPLAKVTGWGPPPELIELGRWAAWRWAGRTATLLRTASPPIAVRRLPAPPAPEQLNGTPDERAVEALGRGGTTLLRLPPAADRLPIALGGGGPGSGVGAVPYSADGEVSSQRFAAGGGSGGNASGWVGGGCGGCDCRRHPQCGVGARVRTGCGGRVRRARREPPAGAGPDMACA